MLPISLIFAVVAALYAAVGFGGGSTYTALLIESGLSWQLVPLVSLSCNLVVVSGGVYHFHKAGHLHIKFAAPFLLSSVPAAFLGGYLRLDEAQFRLLLGTALLVAGTFLLADRRWGDAKKDVRDTRQITKVTIGTVLGGLAGATGIGGGIYLAPLLHIFRLAEARAVAALCSLFILVNSAAGLAGQLMKLGPGAGELADASLLILPVAVLIGGQAGSRAGSRWLPAKPVRQLTGLVILLVAVRLLFRVIYGGDP